jgi:hypothetical protein
VIVPTNLQHPLASACLGWPYEDLAKFGYTPDVKYKYLIVFLFFWLHGKKAIVEIFIIFFPSLLVIKVEIFNSPFYIFGYTLKTKYKNLEFFLKQFPITFGD